MKTCAILLGLALLVGGGAAAGPTAEEAAAKVLAVTGEAFLSREGEVGKRPVREGDRVYPHERIETIEGAKVKLMLAEAVLVVIDERTTAEIDELATAREGANWRGRMKLGGGRLRAILERSPLFKPEFGILTSNAIAAVKGTDTVVAHPVPELTNVFTLDGIVDVRNADPAVAGFQLVRAGFQCEVRGKEPPRPPRPISNRKIQELRGDLWLLQALQSGVGTLQGFKPLTRDRRLSSIVRPAAGAAEADLKAPRDNPALNPSIAGEFIYPETISPHAPPQSTGGRGPSSAGGFGSPSSMTGGVPGETGASRPPSPPRDWGPEFFGGGRKP